MNSLALLGGKKVRQKPFPPHPIIEREERQAVLRALDDGVLSGFIGAPGKNFTGAKFVKEFETKFAKWNKSRFAVAVNSATAGLHCSLIAIGVGIGDEVIVPPLTFSATATSVLMCGAVPIFADVNPLDGNIDFKSISSRISKKTKAIIVVHLFGKPADMSSILRLAKQHRLKVIEDAAQAAGAIYRGERTGNMGDLGVFSFTASKQITTLGEGGMIVTNNKFYMRRCQLVRNHGEVLGKEETKKMMAGILGWNYRLSETAAAFGIAQLNKLDKFLSIRRQLSKYLQSKLRRFSFLDFPSIEKDGRSSYFIFPIFFNKTIASIHRDTFVQALKAEGIPATSGYSPLLYLNPVYKLKRFFNNGHFPFSVSQVKKNVYKKGLCPNAEKLFFEDLIVLPVVRPYASHKDMDDIVSAIAKIEKSFNELKNFEKEHLLHKRK